MFENRRRKLVSALLLFLFCILAISLWWRRDPSYALVSLLDTDTRAFLNTAVFRIGVQSITVLFLLKTFIFLVFLNLISRIVSRVLSTILRDYPRIDQHGRLVISTLVTWAIYVVGILVGTEIEGINLATLVIFGGTLGVGLGFGFQTLASNLIAGLVLLFDPPMRLGDQIEFGDRNGEVLRLGARSASIRTYDNAILVVPNAQLITSPILNWTTNDPRARVKITVPVAYGSNPQEVIEILTKIAGDHQDVLNDPCPLALLVDITRASFTFLLVVWTVRLPDELASLRSSLYISILQAFQEKGIELPVPLLDLTVKSVDHAIPSLDSEVFSTRNSH